MRSRILDLAARRPELVAGAGLFSLYLAVMNGHLMSSDGLIMWRQALAIAYHHSFSFVPPIWWGGTLNSSYRGLGASMQYVPTALLFFWLSPHVPVQSGPQYDFGLLYKDVLYVVAGAPVWAFIAACTAALSGLITREIWPERRAVLWTVAFYGLGSPAFAASRGDWPQPVVALCWALGIFACLHFANTGSKRWLWVSAAAVFYGVQARPLEGSFLLPGVLVVLAPQLRKYPWLGVGQVAAWVASVLVTLWLNDLRFGSPLNFGYPGTTAWTTPLWVGLPGDLLSPGRGIVWEFPALVLSVVGFVFLWRHGKRWESIALVGPPIVLLLEACQFFDWVGGWDWGFRFFQPALPLIAVLAGAGVLAVPRSSQRWLPAVLLAGGIIWNVPVVLTDLLGGYGATYAVGSANWHLQSYPPIGAWAFLHHILPTNSIDSASVDIIWVRAIKFVGPIAFVPFLLFASAAAWLWTIALRGTRQSLC